MIGFILFGISPLALLLLRGLFPENFEFVKTPVYLSIYYLAIFQNISNISGIFLVFWTLTWVLFIGIGCYYCKKSTKFASLPIILGLNTFLFSILPVIILSGYSQDHYLYFLSFISFSFYLGLNFSYGNLPMFFILFFNIIPGISGSQYVKIFVTILNQIDNLLLIAYFIYIGICFFTIKLDRIRDIYKKITCSIIASYIFSYIYIIFSPISSPVLYFPYYFTNVDPVLASLIELNVLSSILLSIFGAIQFVFIDFKGAVNVERIDESEKKSEEEVILSILNQNNIISKKKLVQTSDMNSQLRKIRQTIDQILDVEELKAQQQINELNSIQNIPIKIGTEKVEKEKYNTNLENEISISAFPQEDKTSLEKKFIYNLNINSESEELLNFNDLIINIEGRENQLQITESKNIKNPFIEKNIEEIWKEGLKINIKNHNWSNFQTEKRAIPENKIITGETDSEITSDKKESDPLKDLASKLREIIISEEEKLEQFPSNIEYIKNNVKKYTTIYKRIKLSKLAEKCNCPITKLESLLEDLISIKEIDGFISDEYFIQHTLTLTEEFFIKNNCEFCSFFNQETHMCSKLDREDINSFIENNKSCIFFEKIQKAFQTNDIRNLQNYLKLIPQIEIKDLTLKFGISVQEMESWLKDLIESGIIKGEISGQKFISFKEVNYDELEEFQPQIGDLCAICYEAIEIQELKKCEECKANFHKECILKYIEEFKRCPVCSTLFGWI